jgi:hypothetical protein
MKQQVWGMEIGHHDSLLPFEDEKWIGLSYTQPLSQTTPLDGSLYHV